MALTGAHAPGATPLTEEDIRGLKLASVTTQGELSEVEAILFRLSFVNSSQTHPSDTL
jgi:hypothetical protein